jgi:YD repeat-containing protein
MSIIRFDCTRFRSPGRFLFQCLVFSIVAALPCLVLAKNCGKPGVICDKGEWQAMIQSSEWQANIQSNAANLKSANLDEGTTYTHDDDDRPTSASAPDQVTAYTLDGMGNRLTETITNSAGVVTSRKSFTYNAREQLVSIVDSVAPGNNATFTYDANGNQIKTVNGGVTTHYTWSSKDRLVAISEGTSPPSATFEYDSNGHRTAKTTGGTRTEYVWDGDDLVAETNVLGNTIASYARNGNLVVGEVRNGVAQ